MEIVSNNSEQDIKRRWAEERLGWVVRELTANLLRVARGAGKPYELEVQLQEVADMIDALRGAGGDAAPGELIASALRFSRDMDGSNPDYRFSQAQETVVLGAMQVVASRLVEQRTQEAAGSS